MLTTLLRTHSKPLAEVAGLQTEVPLNDGSDSQYINLDNAASTPALTRVVQAVTESMQWYASVHRGAGYKSQVATEAYEAARGTVGAFVGADPHEHTVIFGKNTTEAINKLAYRLDLKKSDIVITSWLEHHSNELPWRTHATVRHIELTPDGELDMPHLQWLLQRYAGRIKLVAITGASNVTGYLPDIYGIAQLAHAAGAQILVDAAQRAAHRSIHMGHLSNPAHIDYVALSAHKMYAPFGTGALIARRDTFLRGAPEYSGGGTVKLVTPSSIDWAAPPDREEAGSPNVVGAIALATAITELQRIGLDTIAAHERLLTRYTLRKLAALPDVRIYGNTTHDRTGVIAFNVTDIQHETLATLLSQHYGIGTRNGCFCAHTYVMRLLGVGAKEQHTLRQRIAQGHMQNNPGMVRISFGLYNTVADVDAFIHALTEIIEAHKK